MFYAKYNDNCHIVDDLKSLPLNDLKEMDSVILLSGKDVVCTSNYLLKDKKFDDSIYNFIVNPDEISHNDINNMTTSTYWNYKVHEKERIYAYNNNGKLITICSPNNKTDDLGDFGFINLTDELLKNYIGKRNGQIYSNSFKLKEDEDKKDFDNICSYITIPLNTTHFIALVKIISISTERKYSQLREYVCFVPYTSEKFEKAKEYKLNKETKRFYYAMECESYAARGLNKIFEQIRPNLEENKYTKLFEEACLAGNYRLSDYLSDSNKEVNIQRVSSFLSKVLKKKFDLKKYYSPVFKIEDFTSYYFNDILVTYKGEIMHCGSGSNYNFQDEHFYQNGLEYIHKVPEFMKKSKKLQTLYKIAFEVADFNRNKYDLDPITGDYYCYGELKNDCITYRDDEGIIVSYRSSEKYYAKKYGYFLEVYYEEAKEIEERMLLAKKLSEKA